MLSFPMFISLLLRKEMTVIGHRCYREILFHAAHHNLVDYLCHDKTLNDLMAHFYWPGIGGNVGKWCTACRKYQLVNSPATPKESLCPFPLTDIPFERMCTVWSSSSY